MTIDGHIGVVDRHCLTCRVGAALGLTHRRRVQIATPIGERLGLTLDGPWRHYRREARPIGVAVAEVVLTDL